MRQWVLIFLLIGICVHLHPEGAFAQKSSANFFFNAKFDSVVVALYDARTEEMLEVVAEGQADSAYSHFLASARLSDKEINSLYRKIKSRRSYVHNRAALSHSDIYIRYYLSGQVSEYIMLSAITGNCLVRRLYCPQKLLVKNWKGHSEMESDGGEDCFYADKVSPYFAAYLKTLLIQNQLYDKLKDDLLFQQK